MFMGTDFKAMAKNTCYKFHIVPVTSAGSVGTIQDLQILC
jgi:hypothetical protein